MQVFLGGSGGESKKCVTHSGVTLVFDGPVKVYAGNGGIPPACTILDLAGKHHPTIQANFDLQGFSDRRVRIEWPDFGVPGLDTETWAQLLTQLIPLGPLFVGCQGGHGRTGTALAVIGCLLDMIPKDADPVAYVRAHYCDEAVESKAQIEYITAITGREVKVGPKGHTVSYNISGAGTTLCPDKGPDGKWCNLDQGHTGEHDTRPRAEIQQATKPAGTPIADLCLLSLPDTHKVCMRPFNHAGACSWVPPGASYKEPKKGKRKPPKGNHFPKGSALTGSALDDYYDGWGGNDDNR